MSETKDCPICDVTIKWDCLLEDEPETCRTCDLLMQFAGAGRGDVRDRELPVTETRPTRHALDTMRHEAQARECDDADG